jgi:hypothetical protein
MGHFDDISLIMSEQFPTLADKCRRCPFQREMERIYREAERYRQTHEALGLYVCDRDFDSLIEGRMQDMGVEPEPDTMPNLRRNISDEMDRQDSIQQEAVDLSCAAALACYEGADVREAVVGYVRHILSKCMSPGQIGGVDQPYVDYDIVPVDMDWMPVENVM